MLNLNWKTRPSFAVAYLTCFFNWRFNALDRSLHKQTCQWDMLYRTCADRHAGKSICQHNGSCRQHNKFYRKLHRQKFLFFMTQKRFQLLNFCVSWRKVYQENISFLEKIHMYAFIKGANRKTNCYWHVHFFFDLC